MKGDDVKNNKRVSTWFIVMLIVATGGFFIWVENPLIHISTMEKKLNASLIIAGVCIIILLFDDAIVRLWQMIISRSYFQCFNLLSGSSVAGNKSKKDIKNRRAEILNHVLTYLRQNYGHRWRAKTRILLTQQWSSELPLGSENIRLHCVPVINLFTLEADPLVVNGLESEYLLRPRRLQDGHTEIYSVDAVSGSQRARNAAYAPFTSFRHKGGMMRRNTPERYYHTRVRRGVSGLYDTWLILGGDAWERDRLAEYETVSLKVTGTNGQLPRRALQSSLLNRCEQILQTPLAVRNLCKPTLPAYPPAEDRFHWRVLSHLGSSFLNMMASAEVLKGTLSLYNWQDDELNYRRLDAIMDVQQHEIQRFEKGFLLRGVDIEITLDENGFTGEGDIHLFGEMLNRFFALYADIHLFNQLTLIIQPAGKSLRWKENHNQRLPGC